MSRIDLKRLFFKKKVRITVREECRIEDLRLEGTTVALKQSPDSNGGVIAVYPVSSCAFTQCLPFVKAR